MPKYAIYICSKELPKQNYGPRAEPPCCRKRKATVDMRREKGRECIKGENK